MQTQIHKTQKTSTRIYLALAGTLCLASGIGILGLNYNPTYASASEYSLDGSSITLDGTNDGSASVTLKTSVARSYVAIQGTWSTKEVVDSGETQTSYLTLSGVKRGGSTTMTYGSNGVCAWTPEDGNGMSVAANSSVLTATYTVDKDTPEGTYKISFSEGLFTYDVNGSDVDEDDTIALDTTITVTRSSGSSDDGDNNDGNSSDGSTDSSNSDDGTTTTTGDSSSDGTSGNVSVPNTGKMTQDGNGANVAVISILTIVATAALLTAVVKAKSHKKIGFGKE